jgi:hypothetical protein
VRELMKFALPERPDLAASSALSRPQPQSSMKPVESDELCWRTGAGPGYDPKLAEKYLRSRYEVTAKALRLTLPRLLSDRRCRDLIGDLRSCGFIDWQILTALSTIVSQWQIERLSSRLLPPNELGPMVMNRLLREETDDDPTFDLSHLTGELLDMQLNVLTVAAFKTWDLGSHRQTPDFNAMKRLLDERYRHSSDDIPHDDPFPGLQPGRKNTNAGEERSASQGPRSTPPTASAVAR